MPLSWRDQVCPPSVVFTTVPSCPTAVPLDGSVKEIPRRISETPLVWLTQVCPPFVVLRIVPRSPTTVPVLASANQTARS